jgi:hypothetical protein
MLKALGIARLGIGEMKNSDVIPRIREAKAELLAVHLRSLR